MKPSGAAVLLWVVVPLIFWGAVAAATIFNN